ncbi:hypothetical protein CC77DRAFT_205354 [Alternaria alternata]|jgi:hypothetical protein|uniref:Uncharacterized protein n=1 Tax=Alternaria alternata TaxID=5599 RepID=A0A177DIJ5_ALTAL|nr:hypothetical protein CC77DRAFT_205354 [Alternaria alternata]OAG18669.1 hypothetical protein CC77DRAFT_205354 [Alternaria alternata]
MCLVGHSILTDAVGNIQFQKEALPIVVLACLVTYPMLLGYLHVCSSSRFLALMNVSSISRRLRHASTHQMDLNWATGERSILGLMMRETENIVMAGN